MLASSLGWTLDAFDFFLVVMCQTAIAREFHQSLTAMAFVTTTVTLATRPIGALLFGAIADRFGRRLPLMLNLVFYSVIQVLSGLAPNFTTFLILRGLFGIGMGGEWGIGASLAMEKVPPRMRGLLSGLLQEGYPAGSLLASLAYWLIFPRYGWRPLFFIGGLPALLAIYVRYHVPESEPWQATRRTTMRDIFHDVARHWPTLLYVTILMTAMNLSSHGTQDLYPVFLEKDWHLAAGQRSAVTALAAIGAILGGLFFGRISDLKGRRRAMIAAFIGAIITIPLWALSPSLALIVVGGMVMQFMVQGAWGVIPAHITELSPDTVRGLLPGLAYQTGALLAGPVTLLQTHLATNRSYAIAMTVTCTATFILAIAVIASGKERRARPFGQKSPPPD
jgi:MFS transporter, SHS family, lactate transporter